MFYKIDSWYIQLTIDVICKPCDWCIELSDVNDVDDLKKLLLNTNNYHVDGNGDSYFTVDDIDNLMHDCGAYSIREMIQNGDLKI